MRVERHIRELSVRQIEFLVNEITLLAGFLLVESLRAEVVLSHHEAKSVLRLILDLNRTTGGSH